MKTRGQQFIESAGLRHNVHHYDHLQKGAAFAASATGIPLKRMIKTLVVVEENGKQAAFVLMPGTEELSLKATARTLGWRKARMATVAEAERFTAYQVGGISPFGSRTALPVLMHDFWDTEQQVGINGGARGCILELTVGDIRRTLQPVIAHLAR